MAKRKNLNATNRIATSGLSVTLDHSKTSPDASDHEGAGGSE